MNNPKQLIQQIADSGFVECKPEEAIVAICQVLVDLNYSLATVEAEVTQLTCQTDDLEDSVNDLDSRIRSLEMTND